MILSPPPGVILDRPRSTVSSSKEGHPGTSEHTIPRNLRGRFRGSGEVGDVRDRVFQHLKIDFSTLNLGGLFTTLFGL